jgi:2-polyprenyl-3-methyl-5-hydroxy-6-metoxy-1,4-benzoquinol methylase
MSTIQNKNSSWDSGVCPVCEAHDSVFLREAYDDRYGQPDLFALALCKGCGHCMTAPRLQESDLGALYGTYYPRKQAVAADIRRDAGRAVSSFTNVKRWWMGTDNQGQYSVRRGESMLDIGCGSGLSLMEAHALGAQAYGVEADPNVRRLAAELDLQVHIGSLMEDPFPGERFDLVTLNQVIEHVPLPDQLLIHLHGRLRTGGRVVLVFPNIRSIWCRLFGARWINWHTPYHLHHFNLPCFIRMAERCGYRVRSVRSITPNLWTFLQFRTLTHVVQRGVPSPLWRVSPSAPDHSYAEVLIPSNKLGLRRWVRRVIYAVLLVPVGVMNRIVDFWGLGDSLRVELVPRESA